jgi:hypothetical protein
MGCLIEIFWFEVETLVEKFGPGLRMRWMCLSKLVGLGFTTNGMCS